MIVISEADGRLLELSGELVEWGQVTEKRLNKLETWAGRISPDWCHVTEQRLDRLEARLDKLGAQIEQLAGQVDGLRGYAQDIEFNLRRDLGAKLLDAEERLRKRMSRATLKIRTEIAAANKRKAKRRKQAGAK